MDPQFYRAIIFHLTREGKRVKDIHEQLIKFYGRDAPSKATVANWVRDSRNGRKDLANRKGSGRPPEIVTPQRIEEVKAIMRKDPTVSLNKLSSMLGIHRKNVEDILEQHI